MQLPTSKKLYTVRASTVLTSSYVAGTIFSMDVENFFGVQLSYTAGDETSMQIKVEVSIDGGVTYGQQITETVSGGTVTGNAAERSFSASGTFSFNVYPVKADLIKISVKATGGTPTGTAAIKLITSWV